MTATRDPDRLLRAWLDLMPTEAPDRAIAAVLQATETTRQLRALPRLGPWRFPMNRLTLISAATLVLAALVGGTYLLAGGPSRPVVPTPTAVPPTTSPKPEGVVAMPDTIFGDWHADAVEIPGVTSAQLVRFSVSWEDGRSGWIQLDGDGSGRQVLQFEPLAAPDGQLRVRTSVGSTGCAAAEVGTYRWSRSSDGLFLTLAVVDDPCAARIAAFARTWVHSLTAVTDGGLGVLPEDPWLEITMPKQRFGASGFGTDASWLHPMSDADPQRFFMLIVDPMGFDAPCKTTRQPIAINPTTSALEGYLAGLSGLSVQGSLATIDGILGRRIDVVVDKNLQCATGDLGMFHSRVPTETDADWTMAPNEMISLWATVKAGHLRVYGYGGDGVTADAAHAVVDSIRFIPSLPTP